MITPIQLQHASRHIANLVPCLSGRCSFRAFAPIAAPATTKRSTRRKITELPTAYILPDGSVAPPLTEFDGGMGTKITAKSRQNDSESSTVAVDSKSTPKRVARKRRVKAPEKSITATVDLLEDAHASTSTSGAPPQPRNQLAREILENLERYPHCILLTRVGQFYESYFDQAVEVANILGIKLTTRKWDGHRIHMCGFPLMHLDKHLKTLVQGNKRFVAMCEEFPAKGGRKLFDRRVTRVITPGTLIDESFLNPYEDNYLLGIYCDPTLEVVKGDSDASLTPLVGLAWIDVSTGEFISKLSSLDQLRDDIERVDPREIVLDSRLSELPLHPIRHILETTEYFVSYTNIHPDIHEATSFNTMEPSQDDDLSSFAREDASNLTFSPFESHAFNLITSFLRSNLLESMPALNSPRREDVRERMRIDAHTIKALEIRESIQEGRVQGSLLSAVRRTVTKSGTRLLTRWLCSPSTCIQEINLRQSLVAFFHARPHTREALRSLLKNIDDAGRIVQKFLLGRGDSNDLLAISTTIKTWSHLAQFVQDERALEAKDASFVPSDWASIDTLVSRLIDMRDLSSRIDRAYSSDAHCRRNDDAIEVEDETVDDVSQTKTGWSFGFDRWAVNPEFSEQLSSLHTELRQCLHRREEIELDFRRRYRAPSLTLRNSSAYGMHVHLAKKREQIELDESDAFTSIAESGSTKCYFNQAWSQLGGRIIETTQAIEAAEREVCSLIKTEVSSHVADLRRNARIMDELDVTLGFAILADEMGFVRPVIKDDCSYKVVNGRHPTVELGLLTSGKVFTPNTTEMTPSSRLHIITGPNMAGKSTLLRQTVLISILAQIGSFVPAEMAEIGVVDQLFSRIGAKDDLFHGRSTFMVEMTETAEILRRATPRSLVIMDEVGRGTTVHDGLAIAFAAVHHLVTVNHCRALFATHFHELADMLGFSESSGDHRGQGVFRNTMFYHTDVNDVEDDRFAYSYRIRPGISRNSHGLKVAQLARLPPVALGVAQRVLNQLKSRETERMEGVDFQSWV